MHLAVAWIWIRTDMFSEKPCMLTTQCLFFYLNIMSITSVQNVKMCKQHYINCTVALVNLVRQHALINSESLPKYSWFQEHQLQKAINESWIFSYSLWDYKIKAKATLISMKNRFFFTTQTAKSNAHKPLVFATGFLILAPIGWINLLCFCSSLHTSHFIY